MLHPPDRSPTPARQLSSRSPRQHRHLRWRRPAAAVTIPADATAITIGADGTVSVTQPNQTQSQQIGQIQLATFPNPGGLNSVGANLLLPTSSSGDPIVGNPGGSEGLGTLLQGSLEQSNVNTVEELIQMILAQRSYEANSQVAKAADQMFQEVNQLGK